MVLANRCGHGTFNYIPMGNVTCGDGCAASGLMHHGLRRKIAVGRGAISVDIFALREMPVPIRSMRWRRQLSSP